MRVFKFRHALLAPLVKHSSRSNNNNNKEQKREWKVKIEKWNENRNGLGWAVDGDRHGMGYKNWDSFNLIRHA